MPASFPTSSIKPLRRIGDVVRWARIDRRMTIGELAERTGISRYTVSKIEQGKPVASWAMALVLSELELALFRGPGNETPPS